MKNIKITLAIFAALQLSGQVKASEAAELLPIEVTDLESSQIFALYQIGQKIARDLNPVYQQFIDITNYPDMSLIDLGEVAISAIDSISCKLPSEITENLKKIIRIKSSANSIAELTAKSVIISDLLIQLVDFSLQSISSELPMIQKYVRDEDIAAIKKKLTNYRQDVAKKKKNKIYKDHNDAESDFVKIIQDLEPIWANHPFYLAKMAQKGKATDAPKSALAKKTDDFANKMKNISIFNYRIAKNKK